MFRFDFPKPGEHEWNKVAFKEENGEKEDGKEITESGETAPDTIVRGNGTPTVGRELPNEIPAEEISLDTRLEDVTGLKKYIHTCRDETPVHYYDCDKIEEMLKEMGDNSVAEAVNQNKDIVPGVYEGGLKVWDCAIDLTDHLSRLLLELRDLQVLELGCGAGLPGMYALSHQAVVTFQDYNKEVLSYYTMPNCYVNISKEKVPEYCKFYAGGWKSFLELMLTKEKKFDMVFASETVYVPAYYPVLHDIFEKLTTDSAKIFVAGKCSYFGLTGGSREFADFVRKRDDFSVEDALVRKKGVFTEVLCLKKKACLKHIDLPE